MRLAFYVPTCGDSPQNAQIIKMLNSAISSKELEDAAMFYNGMDFNPHKVDIGQFNATELWSWKGKLICTTLENMISSKRVVNKFESAFWFNLSEVNQQTFYKIFKIGQDPTVKVFTTSKVDQLAFYRITKQMPALVEDFCVKGIKEVFDG